MTTEFCLDALEEAISRFRVPDIFNSDQDSQFTDGKFTTIMKEAKTKTSQYIKFYNTIRFHQSLENQTPDELYFKSLKKFAA